MKEKKPLLDGQVAREDPSAVSARPDLPAFLARPAGAPAYYGFPLLPNSERDGYVFGAITRPRTGTSASWGDAYVVAPDGSRAGIVWVTKGPVTEVVLPPGPGRWGVYQFCFEQPVESDAELIRNLHAILPRLKELYAAAKSTKVDDDTGNADGSA
ncbi:MAG TPA: hypothetical protein VGR92_14045 [Steroidobacteraceae bacterium]|nr:hypothetical protein [Steroidobacteraceae bacterium]